ncbi:MAG TPA: XRE family transcriptional regulator [Ruminococcaceae bacterium]|jgi:transcriptional regulator with XRE-family HTH domain|nr:XRE family transcriptional regulator [Oscillospiraceae bacterium]
MKIYERIKILRKNKLHLTQEEFSSKINMSRSNLGSIEVGRISVTDRVIADICSAFNVNEEWLKNGTGEIFKKPEYFSLDEYARQKDMSPLELEVIKNFMDFSPNERSQILDFLRKISPKSSNTDKKNEIDKKVDDYRRELEAEKSIQTSKVSRNSNKNAG